MPNICKQKVTRVASVHATFIFFNEHLNKTKITFYFNYNG